MVRFIYGVIALYSIFLFTACSGGLDLVLPTGEIYKVDAYINEYSLKTCSIIRQDDAIRPYFVNTIRNDPDIQGLIVYLQTSSGTAVSKKTWYTINKETLVPEEIKSEEPVVLQSDAPQQGKKTEPEISPEPSAGDEPQQLIRENVIENWSQYRILEVSRLDQDLPSFTLTESIEIGQYLLVFQVLGEKEVLYTIEKPIYFLGDAELVFEDMQHYLPGFSSDAHLVPPGTNVLLEAEISADKRLDPYIMWYDGKKCIDEGKLSAGAAQFIWKAPEKTGFHTIKAVVFPFQPIQNSGINGTARELSLPVSSKSKNTGYFAKQADQFIHWYQFQSNLLDSKAPSNDQSSLRLQDNQEPQWLTYSSMYGLAVGNKPYLLPDTSFLFDSGEEGLGRLVFHLFPLSEGTIFTGAFKTFDKTSFTPLAPLNIRLSLKEQKLILTVAMEETVYQESADLTAQGFITPHIIFSLRQSQVTARLILEETGIETNEITLDLACLVTGEGTFQIGEAETAQTAAILDELGIAFTKGPVSPNPELLEADTKPEGEEILAERLTETPQETETA